MSDNIVCPHCGSDEGYFKKALVSETCSYDFSGNGYDSVKTVIRGGNKKYCLDCKRDITKFLQALKR
jgi:hypothetical protein